MSGQVDPSTQAAINQMQHALEQQQAISAKQYEVMPKFAMAQAAAKAAENVRS